MKLTCTPRNNSIQLSCDHKIFAHKLKLIEYFDHYNVAPVDQKDVSLVQGKLDFLPLRERNKELETHIGFMNNINVTDKKSNKNFLLKE